MRKARGKSSSNKIILLRQARSYHEKQNEGAELPTGKARIQVFFQALNILSYTLLLDIPYTSQRILLPISFGFYWSYNVISHLQTNLIEDKARQTVEQSSPTIMNYCHKGETQITKARAFLSIQINVNI